MRIAENLDELLDDLKSADIELSVDLPTFGGDEPIGGGPYWSWDADRVLVGLCVGDLRIRSREAGE